MAGRAHVREAAVGDMRAVAIAHEDELTVWDRRLLLDSTMQFRRSRAVVSLIHSRRRFPYAAICSFDSRDARSCCAGVA